MIFGLCGRGVETAYFEKTADDPPLPFVGVSRTRELIVLAVA